MVQELLVGRPFVPVMTSTRWIRPLKMGKSARSRAKFAANSISSTVHRTASKAWRGSGTAGGTRQSRRWASGGLLLPLLIPAALWKRSGERWMKVLFAANFALVLALLPIISGLIQRVLVMTGTNGRPTQEFLNHRHGLLPRIAALAVVGPIGVEFSLPGQACRRADTLTRDGVSSPAAAWPRGRAPRSPGERENSGPESGTRRPFGPDPAVSPITPMGSNITFDVVVTLNVRLRGSRAERSPGRRPTRSPGK